MKGPFVVVFPLFFIAITLISDLYTWQGIRTVSGFFLPDAAHRWLKIGYWSFTVIMLLGLFAGYLSIAGKETYTLLFRVFVNAFFAYLAAKMFFGVFLLAEDLYRLVLASFRATGLFGGYHSFALPARHIAFSMSGFVVFVIIIGLFVHGIFYNRHNYKVHRVSLSIDNLPPAFDGFRMVQISDFHAGSFHGLREARKGFGIIKSLDADLLVFTGDMVNNRAAEMEKFVDDFRSIQPPLGKFSILGNHDYGDYIPWKYAGEEAVNRSRLIELEQQAGFGVLINAHVPLVRNGDTIYLAGVENWGNNFVRKGDLRKALEGIPVGETIILLSHDPSHWDKEVKSYHTPVALTLSGHTHGFQFGFETPWFKWSPVALMYREWSGLSEENGLYRYINRGFGFIGLEGRVGIRPEITLIELKRKN